MPIVKAKPTSPGRRFVEKVVHPHLYKGRPYAALVESKGKSGGRNNNGRITSRHIGGGHKHHYRIIDFKRTKDNIPAVVERIEYDPNRTSRIALISYRDGEKTYILAPIGLLPGAKVESGSDAGIRTGNCLPLRLIPTGTLVHNLELVVGKGGKLVRSAGAGAQVLSREDIYVLIRLPSGEIRRVPADCRATIGQLSNVDHKNVSWGKAGKTRHRGRRPHVRGSAMNPRDHPHGGGEGRVKGNHPMTPWGKPTLGYRTRNNKRTDKFIVKRKK